MSHDPDLSPDGPPAGSGADAAPRRAGSVTLRAGDGADPASLGVDPANQSLADALRVMLRLLQFGMVVLLCLYLLSGMKSVNEGEEGIRLMFGRIVESNIKPGFRWSAPFPFGELVKVKQGYQELEINKDFWADIPAGQESQPLEKLQGSPSLRPDVNGTGSLITADQNIAHTRWKVGFRRKDVGQFAQHILPESEQDIVRAIVKRSIVQAVSGVTLSELLHQNTKEGTASVPKRAQIFAQDELDKIGSGLEITVLTMDPPIPPLFVRDVFNKATAASADANKAIQDAQTYRSELMNQTAGDAARYLLYYIDRYEEALARNAAAAENDATLGTIDSILNGQKTTVVVLGDDGQPQAGPDGKPRTIEIAFQRKGDVARVLTEADLYYTNSGNYAKTVANRYAAKLALWKSNPSIMIQTEWASAMKTFMTRDNFEMMLVPPGVNNIRLQLNSDPDIEREVTAAAKKRAREAVEKKKIDDLMRRGRETTTGLDVHE